VGSDAKCRLKRATVKVHGIKSGRQTAYHMYGCRRPWMALENINIPGKPYFSNNLPFFTFSFGVDYVQRFSNNLLLPNNSRTGIWCCLYDQVIIRVHTVHPINIRPTAPSRCCPHIRPIDLGHKLLSSTPTNAIQHTVKHVHFASIKFSRFE